MRFRTLALLLVALLLAVPAFAQEQRGSIEGTVKDASGGVLPGATVEARSAGGAVTSSVTDSSGLFRFPSLAPGYYTVTTTLSGFQVSKFENVEVLLGQIKRLEFAMAVAGVAETITVTGESPLVDVRQSARATSLRAEQLDLLPKGRDFMSLVTQAPGANYEAKSAGVMIDGATTGENRYIVDGAETSNIVFGGTGKAVIADFIEEVQIKSSGYTAEYGGSTGGVINVLTRSGTNSWRGNLLFNFENSGLQGARPPTLRLALADSTKSEYISYPKDGYRRMEPGFSIGGPIAKDKTWFFAAYQPSLIKYDRVTTQKDTGSDLSTTQDQTIHYLTANNTAQIGSKLRTRVAYNNSWSQTKGQQQALDGSTPSTNDFNKTWKYPNWSVSGQADYVASSKLFFGARVGYYTADEHDFGIPAVPRYSFPSTSNIGMAGVPADLQRTTGFSSVPTNTAVAFDKQGRLAFQVDGTLYGNFGGQHTIKGGFQIDRLSNSVNSGEQGNLVRLYWGQSFAGMKGTYGYYRVRTNGASGLEKQGFITQGDVSTTNYGLFIQDAWTINSRLTLNLGLRTENEKVPAYAAGPGIPTVGINFPFSDKLAPRLGFAWDLKGDGLWKAYGSWGIFYDIFKMNLPRGSFGGEKWLEYWYTLDTPDWTTLTDAASCPPAEGGPGAGACPGTFIRGPVDYRHPSFGADAIDPGLKPMQSRELSLGLEHQLSPVVAVSARYVRKWLIRAVDDTGSLDANFNEIYVTANPGFGLTQTAWSDPLTPLPKARRDYDSVEFALTKNMSHNYYLRLSYMWSRLYGNYSGLDQTDENGRQSPNTGRLYDYPLMSFDQSANDVEGPLATDRPHQFKAQFIYSMSKGFSVGVNEFIASGIPKTSEMPVISSSAYPLFYKGRGDAGRMPMYSQTDLFIQQEFKIGGDRRFQAYFNLLNLFNQSNGTNFFATVLASGKTLDFSEQAFYEKQLPAFDTLAANILKDPRYMQTTGFQTPIQARFGVKFLF
jgi:hypothetical protein